MPLPVVVGVCALDIAYPQAPPKPAPPAVAATVPQFPCALNSCIELELEAAYNTLKGHYFILAFSGVDIFRNADKTYVIVGEKYFCVISDKRVVSAKP